MTYQSLYRKWRSQNFEEVMGQVPIIQTLRNAIKNKRISHAYLFSGPRGTGKTSTARIFAKALNCEHGPTATPCGICDNCVKIRDGHAVDVIEIDAASNRGIDEIRELREKVRYAPVEGRYKVYIIDEVHMLTPEAFNALLKTLEEPPAQVVFILATTELQRVPLTILSRCQRLDFKRIPYAEIVAQLKAITSKEKFTIEESALNLIARNSEGSMRDAISLLDQLISFCEGKITHDDVAMILGTAGAEALFDFGDAIGRGDTAKSLELVNKFILEGKSVPQVTKDILSHLRHILLIKLGSGSIIEETADHVEKLKGQSADFTLSELQDMIRVLSRAETDMKWHPQSRLVLEVAMIELCSLKAKGVKDEPSLIQEAPGTGSNYTKIKEVLDKVQKSQKQEAVTPVKAPDEQVPAQKNAASGNGGLLDRIRQNWTNVLEAVKKRTLNGYISLHEGSPVEAVNGKLVIAFKKGFAFHKFRLEEKNNRSAVESALKEILGDDMEISCVVQENQASQQGGGKNMSVKDLVDIFGGDIVKNA